ncbi:MAG: hypothetical protein C0P67_003745 [Bacillota bacterium]|jgi:hypothetical protein
MNREISAVSWYPWEIETIQFEELPAWLQPWTWQQLIAPAG